MPAALTNDAFCTVLKSSQVKSTRFISSSSLDVKRHGCLPFFLVRCLPQELGSDRVDQVIPPSHRWATLPSGRPSGVSSTSALGYLRCSIFASRAAHRHFLSLQYRTTSTSPVRRRTHSFVRLSRSETPNMALSHFLCATFSLFSSRRVRDQVFEAYAMAGDGRLLF